MLGKTLEKISKNYKNFLWFNGSPKCLSSLQKISVKNTKKTKGYVLLELEKIIGKIGKISANIQ